MGKKLPDERFTISECTLSMNVKMRDSTGKKTT